MDFCISEKLTDNEKALLAYLEEVNFSKIATDETFDKLQRYFSDKQIVEITWMNATKNYFNFMAKPLGLKSDGLKYNFKKIKK